MPTETSAAVRTRELHIPGAPPAFFQESQKRHCLELALPFEYIIKKKGKNKENWTNFQTLQKRSPAAAAPPSITPFFKLRQPVS